MLELLLNQSIYTSFRFDVGWTSPSGLKEHYDQVAHLLMVVRAMW